MCSVYAIFDSPPKREKCIPSLGDLCELNWTPDKINKQSRSYVLLNIS